MTDDYPGFCETHDSADHDLKTILKIRNFYHTTYVSKWALFLFNRTVIIRF